MRATRDQLLARVLILECERDCYIREIAYLRRLNGVARVPVTLAVIEALRTGRETSRAIAAHARIERKSVQTILSELKSIGIVVSKRSRPKGEGRPEENYRLRA